VDIRPLSIAGAFEITPRQWSDDRGTFLEWYRSDALAEIGGVGMNLHQANTSISRRGVVRGIHFADVPPGQAKHVTVTRGSAIDFIVDIRVGSPTFGSSCSVALDDVKRRAVFLAEGLGHAFVALEDDTVVSYLVSGVYDPAHEHGISPLDPAIGLELPFAPSELVISEKDLRAPTLDEARELGILPIWAEARRYAGTSGAGS
jgi:dTDP-4-dehydrorhamnose 3,5-epimerase